MLLKITINYLILLKLNIKHKDDVLEIDKDKILFINLY